MEYSLQSIQISRYEYQPEIKDALISERDGLPSPDQFGLAHDALRERSGDFQNEKEEEKLELSTKQKDWVP